MCNLEGQTRREIPLTTSPLLYVVVLHSSAHYGFLVNKNLCFHSFISDFKGFGKTPVCSVQNVSSLQG